MSHGRFSRHSIVATPEGGVRVKIGIREHEVVTDQPERAGGTDSAPTPLELLGASLAGCVALYVHKHCVRVGLPSHEIAVEVKPIWREDPGRVGRFDVTVHVPESFETSSHAGVEAAARGCPVHHTLMHLPEIDIRVKSDTLIPAG
jgi:putative redox protein